MWKCIIFAWSDNICIYTAIFLKQCLFTQKQQKRWRPLHTTTKRHRFQLIITVSCQRRCFLHQCRVDRKPFKNDGEGKKDCIGLSGQSHKLPSSSHDTQMDNHNVYHQLSISRTTFWCRPGVWHVTKKLQFQWVWLPLSCRWHPKYNKIFTFSL